MRSLLKSVLGVACALTIGLASGSAAYADKLADILSKGVVRIGVPLDAPPFGSQDANRNPVGFDIELAEMVGKALGESALARGGRAVDGDDHRLNP